MMILIRVIKNHAHIHHLVKEFSLEAKTQIYSLNNNEN